MATVYIDPDGGNDSWDGSRGIFISGSTGPKKTIPSIASNTDYYILRGTTIDRSTKIDVATVTNITIGAYWMDGSIEDTGDSILSKPTITVYVALTSTDDFTDLGGDVWVYSSGNEYWDPRYLLALGLVGDKNAQTWTERRDYLDVTPHAGAGFDAYGQWDANLGGVGDASKLYIYSDVNPVTKWGTVYHVMGQRPVIHVRAASSNITIENLRFLNAYSGVRVSTNTGETNTNITVQACAHEHTYFGNNIGSAGTGINDTLKVVNNVYDQIGNVPINPTGPLPDLLVKSNIMNNVGVCESIGGIYGHIKGDVDRLAICEQNYVKDLHLTDYWGESFGYYFESTSVNARFYRNYVENAGVAGLHSNSGEQNLIYSGNIVVNCPHGLSDSDQAENDDGQCTYSNNLFYSVGFGGYYHRPAAVTNANTKIYNNIFVGDGRVGGICFHIHSSIDDIVNGVVNDNNIVYNFDTNIYRVGGGAVQTTYGSENVSSAPLLNADYTLSSASPALYLGIRWWSNARPVGYDGEPFPDWDIDTGANQSLFSPFHPVNL